MKYVHCVTAELRNASRPPVVLAVYTKIDDAIDAARCAGDVPWLRNVGIHTTILNPDRTPTSDWERDID